MTQNAGFFPEKGGAPFRNAIGTDRIIFYPSGLKISPSRFTTI